MAISRPVITCESCGYSWTPRGRSYSLRCPDCGARLTQSQSKSNVVGGCGCLLVGIVGGVYGLSYFARTDLEPARVNDPRTVVPGSAVGTSAPTSDHRSTTLDESASQEPKPESAGLLTAEESESQAETGPEPERLVSKAEAQRIEKSAKSELNMAKALLRRDGHEDAAKRRLRAIMEKYPETESATEAESLLKKIEKQDKSPQ